MAEMIPPLKNRKLSLFQPPSFFFFFPSSFHGLFHHYCKQLSSVTELGGRFPQKTNVAQNFLQEEILSAGTSGC